MTYLSLRVMAEKGDHVCLISKSAGDNVTLMAVCWVDRDRRYFNSTTGTAKQAAPIYRERLRSVEGHATRVELEIPIPEVCDTYYSVCSKIDHHNRCRQDDLKLEKKLRTMRWPTRVNNSLIAMCVVDSWLL